MELKEIKLDLSTIVCKQKCGPYGHQYTKVEPIKEKRRTIEGVSYNTKKSKLVFYKNNWEHENNFEIIFIYEAPDGKYFNRRFTNMGEEPIKIVSKQYVIDKVNANKSLF